jgi:hypothetical protein
VISRESGHGRKRKSITRSSGFELSELEKKRIKVVREPNNSIISTIMSSSIVARFQKKYAEAKTAVIDHVATIPSGAIAEREDYEAWAREFMRRWVSARSMPV